MIVVDSSVWIAALRHRDGPAVRKLKATARRENLIVGDLIVLEVLQGAQSDKDASRIEANLRCFRIESMLDPSIAISAASNYRALRNKGITIRKTVDLIIATFCIERGYELLHQDRDFEPMALHLGLRVA